jgi:hypothetical protein
MTRIDQFTPTSVVGRKVALTLVGLVGVTASLCVLFLSMRAVMDIGGVCASGNTPYTPRVPCPKGVSGLLVGSIFGGLIFLGLYAVNTFSLNLTLLAWPALFISLGFNFWDYGISPPEDFGEGPVWGWIVCGVVFVLMGGVPLLVWIGAVMRGRESRIRNLDPQTSLRQRLNMSTGGNPPPDPEAAQRTQRVYAIAIHVAGIVLGIWAGMELYEAVTGSDVSIGFR